MNYDWKKLDNELIELCKNEYDAVSKFVDKYNMSMQLVYYRLKKLKVKVKSQKGRYSLEKNPNWKGGKHIENGYVLVSIGNGKYKAEHILVMEKKLGRKLFSYETVHHIDETFEGRSNNKDNNLQLVTKSDHVRHHMRGRGYSIYFDKCHSKWKLTIQNKINSKWYYYGYYETEEEALRVLEQKFKNKNGREANTVEP